MQKEEIQELIIQTLDELQPQLFKKDDDQVSKVSTRGRKRKYQSQEEAKESQKQQSKINAAKASLNKKFFKTHATDSQQQLIKRLQKIILNNDVLIQIHDIVDQYDENIIKLKNVIAQSQEISQDEEQK